MSGYFEEKHESKYLVLDDADKNKEFSRKYEEVWKGIKKEIQTINAGKKIEYEKDYMKMRFKSNDDLPLNYPVKLRLLAIIIRCVISKIDKFYPQLFLDDALFEL